MAALNLHRDDVKIIADALRLAAGRKSSMARANYGAKRGLVNHGRQAELMNEIERRLRTLLGESRDRDVKIEQE